MRKAILVLGCLVVLASFALAGGEPMSAISQDAENCPLKLTQCSILTGIDPMATDYQELKQISLQYQNISDKAIKGAEIKVTLLDGNDQVVKDKNGNSYYLAKFAGWNTAKDGYLWKSYYPQEERFKDVAKARAKVLKVYFVDGSSKSF